MSIPIFKLVVGPGKAVLPGAETGSFGARFLGVAIAGCEASPDQVPRINFCERDGYK